MEFVKFNFKHFSFLYIFDFTLIFRISTHPKIAKKWNSLADLVAVSVFLGRFGGHFSILFRFGGRFGILGPIRNSYAPVANLTKTSSSVT